MLLILLAACEGKSQDSSDPPFEFAHPTDMPSLRGPGGPTASFASEELWQNCAYLEGGENDVDHHNLVVPYRGHLLLPWAPEWGRGGLTFFEMNNPCQPEKVGEGFHERMRESHAIGLLHLPETDPHSGEYAITAGVLGIQVWDISIVETPEMINYLEIEGVFYPDAYTGVVLSVFWQHPWLYVAAADNGIFIVNTENPKEPELVHQHEFDVPLRAAGVFAIGNHLLVTSAEGSSAEILDISDPSAPQPIPGGRFDATDSTGTAYEAYHGNLAGPWALFARKENGGGVMITDISDPSNPSYVADVRSEGGNSGYVFYDEGYAFLGDSNWAIVYDLRDLDNIVEVGRGNLEGDLDTMTPYGNVAILSVDDESVDKQSSAVMPWQSEPDTLGPVPWHFVPGDGSTNVPLGSRIGVSFNEMVEPSSAFAGSVRLYEADGTAVDGWVTAQENTVNYSPKINLKPNTTYRFEVLESGIKDINMNAVGQTVQIEFTTVGSE